MKHLLLTTLENTKQTHDLIYSLSRLGYNGTVLSSTSLKHILTDENEDVPSFISLAHYHEIEPPPLKLIVLKMGDSYSRILCDSVSIG